MGVGRSAQNISARRRLRLLFGKFMLDDNGVDHAPRVSVREPDADIGCTTVTREAVEELYQLFEKHYPKCRKSGIDIQ